LNSSATINVSYWWINSLNKGSQFNVVCIDLCNRGYTESNLSCIFLLLSRFHFETFYNVFATTQYKKIFLGLNYFRSPDSIPNLCDFQAPQKWVWKTWARITGPEHRTPLKKVHFGFYKYLCTFYRSEICNLFNFLPWQQMCN
jgi:hypothetical protein